MNLEMTHVDVWATEIDDQPGGLALKLRAMADYGANLDCVVARRLPDKKGRGIVFVSPLYGGTAAENADQIGLRRVDHVATLRVEGPDQIGLGATLARTVADTGVNMHGFSAMTFGHRFVCYLGFDNVADRDKAETALKKLNYHDWRFWRHSKPADVKEVATR